MVASDAVYGGFFGTVVIGLIRAPRDIHLEALAEIGRLNLRIEDKEALQRALNALWKLRRDGTQLRNREIVPGDYESWKCEMRAWHQSVLKEAAEITESLKQWLETLERMPQNPVAEPIDDSNLRDAHEHDLRFYSEVLRRLSTFLEKDLKWPKIGVDTWQRSGC